MKLDGEVLNELFRRGILKDKGLKKINIINYYESRSLANKRHAVKETATRFNCSPQYIHKVLKDDKSPLK